jgi:hypothetical protein
MTIATVQLPATLVLRYDLGNEIPLAKLREKGLDPDEI